MIPAMFVLAWLVVMVNGCMMLGLDHMGGCPTAQADIPTPCPPILKRGVSGSALSINLGALPYVVI